MLKLARHENACCGCGSACWYMAVYQSANVVNVLQYKPQNQQQLHAFGIQDISHDCWTSRKAVSL